MKTNREMLMDVQHLLDLNQKELGVYIGVSTRTVNSWMTGERECPDHVAEMVLRLAKADAKVLYEDEQPSTFMRWAVIDDKGDEFITVCGSKADAIREAEAQWSHLTERERERRNRFEAGLIHVQLMPEKVDGSRFTYANEDGSIDGDVYEIAKVWK